MTIALEGGEGLFDRIGTIGKVLLDINTYQSSTVPTFVENVLAEYDTLRDVVSAVPALQTTARANASAIMPTLQTAAQQTIIRMVLADNPAKATSLATSLAELITQMKAAPESVQSSAVAVSASALSTNAGTGAVVVSTKRGDGLVQELAVAEVAPLLCTVDSQTGGATAGQETFVYTGQKDNGDPWAHDWPTGSSASATIVAIDASINAGSTSSGNMLTNGDFEDFTANLPDNWVAVAGTPGTNFKQSTVVFHDGVKSLEIVGGATTVTLSQKFGVSSAGSPGILSPSRSYAVNFWLKADVVPAAGVLTVELVDGSATVINDDQGTANSFTVTLSGISTSFVAKNTVFRLPRALPSEVKIRIRISTAISSGSSIFIDRMAMAPMTQLYAGGPSACVFSGTTKFVLADGWTVTTTNDRGGASLNATFQALFDRLFGMRALGLLLPSASSESVPDSLIA